VRPEDVTPLDAVGELTLESDDGINLRVLAKGPSVDLQVPDLRSLLRLAKHSPGRQQRRGLMGHAVYVAQRGDMTFSLRIRDSEVVRLAPDSRGGWLSRLLGFAPAEVSLKGLFRAVFR
jgi:hypothetical protein